MAAVSKCNEECGLVFNPISDATSGPRNTSVCTLKNVSLTPHQLHPIASKYLCDLNLIKYDNNCSTLSKAENMTCCRKVPMKL